MTDEKSNADADGCQESRLVLDGRQHDDRKDQLHGGEHFDEHTTSNSTVSTKSDVNGHRSRQRR